MPVPPEFLALARLVACQKGQAGEVLSWQGENGQAEFLWLSCLAHRDLLSDQFPGPAAAGAGLGALDTLRSPYVRRWSLPQHGTRDCLGPPGLPLVRYPGRSDPLRWLPLCHLPSPALRPSFPGPHYYFPHTDPHILALYQTRDGTLWVGTEYGGL